MFKLIFYFDTILFIFTELTGFKNAVDFFFDYIKNSMFAKHNNGIILIFL